MEGKRRILSGPETHQLNFIVASSKNLITFRSDTSSHVCVFAPLLRSWSSTEVRGNTVVH